MSASLAPQWIPQQGRMHRVRWRYSDVGAIHSEGQPSLLPDWQFYPVRVTIDEVEESEVDALLAWLAEHVARPVWHEWRRGDRYDVHDCPSCECVDYDRLAVRFVVPARSSTHAVELVRRNTRWPQEIPALEVA